MTTGVGPGCGSFSDPGALPRALELHGRLSTTPEPLQALVATYDLRSALPFGPPAPGGTSFLSKMAIARPVERTLGPKTTLEQDTREVLELRYPLALALLRERPLARPAELTHEVYRRLLEVDLADPYLGLAPAVLGGELGAPLSPPERDWASQDTTSRAGDAQGGPAWPNWAAVFPSCHPRSFRPAQLGTRRHCEHPEAYEATRWHALPGVPALRNAAQTWLRIISSLGCGSK
jgi:hypothetical protein